MSKREILHSSTRGAILRGLFTAALLLSGSGALSQEAGKSAATPAANSNETRTVTASSQPQRELKQCIECHEAYFAIADSKHFVEGDARTPKGAGEECKACHGDTTAHNRTPRVKGLVPIVYGKKAPPGPQTEACLNCHQGGARLMWQGSTHERTQQVCANCHKAHTAKDPVVVAETQAGVCFECHKDRRAEMMKSSAHPIKTGFQPCSSCHNPHGSPARALLVKESVNNTCFTCHADKRGPFLWEHPSAKDDCTNCHNPHGTNNAPMLKVRQPYLCQQCHQTNSHSSTVYSGQTLQDLTITTFSAQRFVARSCTNCHAKVHGTNHPSGARLQR